MARFLTPVLLLLLLPLTSCQWLASPKPPPTAPDQSKPTAPTPDTLVIPGQRVGPVTAETSRADLADRYGEADLEDASIPMGEGTTAAGTIVTPGPNQQFSVVWQDASQTRPQLVRDFGSAWRTPEGLGIGVSYAEVEAILGDFEIYGFAWDYGGTVSLAGSQLDQYDDYLLLRLSPAEKDIDQHPEAYRAMMGSQLFASDNPNLDVLNPTLYEMVMYFDPLP